MKKISILIADDHSLVRETLALLLNADTRFNVAALAGTGEKAIEMAKQIQPDIVLMDINLPGLNGFEATQTIREISPATKIIGVSMHAQSSYVSKMMQNGASGYLTKNISIDEMSKAIVEVYYNQTYISHGVNTVSDQEKAFNSVSKREIEIIEFIRKGYSSREIAEHLKVSIKTIEAHRYKVLKKLNLKNAAALVNYINTNQSFIYN